VWLGEEVQEVPWSVREDSKIENRKWKLEKRVMSWGESIESYAALKWSQDFSLRSE
jgi:hypothetical protein